MTMHSLATHALYNRKQVDHALGGSDVRQARANWIDPAAIGELFSAVGQRPFFERLRAFVRYRVHFDNCVVVAFSPFRKPLVLYQWAPEVPDYFGMLHHDMAYQNDPFFQQAMKGPQDTVHTLQSIAPIEFFDSAFFDKYYRQVGMIDELGLISSQNAEHILHFSISRSAQSTEFAQGDWDSMAYMGPLLSVALKQHCARWFEQMFFQRIGRDEDALKAFTPLLVGRLGPNRGVTPREAEVAALMLRGHTNDSIALILGIRAGTVKVHRKNLYAKLEISSTSELFRLCKTPVE